MRTAAAPRKALTGTTAFEGARDVRAAIHLRLRAGDERGQTVDAAGVGNDGLRLVQR